MTAIAFEYPEEIAAMREGLATFIRAEVIPRHEKHHALLENGRRKYTEEGAYSPEVLALIREVRMASARAGYYAMCAPEEIGGGGLGYLAYFAGWEALYRQCGARYWLGAYAISHWAKGPSPVLRNVTPALLRDVLPGIVSGEHSLCFAMSEPGAGSDASMMKSRAVRDGDGWRLTGSKIWISNGPYAEHAIVFAVTDPELAARRKGGISAFLVPTSAQGFVVEKLIKMWGHEGTVEAQLRFDDVRIEPHQLVGELDQGFKIGMMGVGLGRMYNSGKSVGMGRWAIEQAVDYAGVRETFGRKIGEYQGVMFPLAESAMQLHAGHLMGLNCAQLLDRGFSATKELAMTKAYCVDAGARALDRVIQAHGAMGFTNEMYLTDAYTQLRVVNVADGTNEVLRGLVAKRLLAGDTAL
jgi:acyl-CoA dehydrogenase